MHRHMLVSVAALTLAVAGCSQGDVNHTVSPDLFGELVDIVTPGYLHWSEASGDTVDPDSDENDLDDNFNAHAGQMDRQTFTSRATAYASGTLAAEHAYADASNAVRFEFHVPEAGRYVIFTRFWRELQETTAAQVSYQSGNQWVELPLVTDIEHRGVFVNVLYPAPSGRATPAFARVEGAGYVGARVGGSGVCLIGEADSGIDGEGISTDARVAAVRRDDDAMDWFLAVGTTRVAVDAADIFRSDGPVTVALNARGDGCIIAEETVRVTIAVGKPTPSELQVSSGTARLESGRVVP